MPRIAVDLNRCQGYAQCAFLAPEVFVMHGDEALLYDPQPGEEQREKLAQAAAACPVQAVLVDAVDPPAAADETAGAVSGR
ncbi:ferredoxin [Streptomyces sp. NBC_00582]|uniref:ferredoxin n=1 Tax=Streptomyces sp. NBC_00582 TaxID=2975783 RepID=UPI002E821BB8|nr:ferredoxin [Streptomyces sp. NBC_00582]WUB59753.1 ferredoxin [Streptomyces sp. NBC_00582]